MAKIEEDGAMKLLNTYRKKYPGLTEADYQLITGKMIEFMAEQLELGANIATVELDSEGNIRRIRELSFGAPRGESSVLSRFLRDLR